VAQDKPHQIPQMPEKTQKPQKRLRKIRDLTPEESKEMM
jgi:hypothetical protein